MNRDLKKGFDIGELAKVIENGEHFKNVERKVEFIYSGKELPVIQKTVSYIITDKFIEANMEKLLKFNIIKGDQL
ncbi:MULTISPECIES: hypothetical protein [Fusobacterium]|jgi:hypothetical protein|uniref:Uncharacterized protein n=2 Tax=Fusobacterium ulcerans TaxID=861 RepID=A0AAX1TP23_9FUSO|nr:MULTISPECIES: hypothetical protein [Fusobacterium]AVQ29518.1 hypothetical protein C4N20_15925 [Fusobacterium ulcerans]EFS26975.1 hypothetical protein FUAG_02490 [Fusobacterium ulcerans ATCC 49185]EHO84634.1 hypothetical protein HMPREF0402_00194 [Fusobacterium ulcerans 12-1B]MDH6456971.1 hypothetical protein [Fusobacterium sp. PH5-7]MEE0138316.1 hypothetical protein [Fusobacterium ulcerans]